MFRIHVRGKKKEGAYYCTDCKKWFDVPVVEEVQEGRGEFWGMPCSETVRYAYCPECGSADIVDADMIELDTEEANE